MAAAVRAAVSVASSPAMLFTRGEMGEEESILRECMSVFKSDKAERALRWVGMVGGGHGGSWGTGRKVRCTLSEG